ncbi:MAG: ADP-ribosylation factor-like protein [Candidatus Heimdallarchaeota archaeon]
MKIALLGLDAAGKSSFLLTLQKKYSETVDLQPTKGINRTNLRILGQDVSIWDFGGQEAYRKKYFRDSKSLTSIDLVLFLLDVSDPKRFEKAIEYLSSLYAETDLGKIDQSHFVFCLHKADPDRVMEDDTILSSISLGSEKLREIVPGAHVFETSIFSPPTILSAVSVGIQKTGATKADVIEAELENFAEQTGSRAVHLLSADAFSFGTFSDTKNSETICEILGFSFVEAWQAITSRQEKPRAILMDLEAGWAFFNPIAIPNGDYPFLVTYTESEDAREPILQAIPAFAKKISDVLQAFSL